MVFDISPTKVMTFTASHDFALVLCERPTDVLICDLNAE
jgi:hypothetical protein